MSATVNQGGRAFPCDGVIERDANGCMYGKEVSSGGMTLRDYFAAKAMQAEYHLLERRDQFKDCAIGAYTMADAMLEARG